MTVPDGNVPLKSVTLAGLVPVPVTTQLTVFVPVVAPNRVTVKVKALLPELPSVCTALVGAIAKTGRTVLLIVTVPLLLYIPLTSPLSDVVPVMGVAKLLTN